MRAIGAYLAACGWMFAAMPAADLSRSIREVTLDPGECWRVRDLALVKDDIRIYLTDGYLTFARPVGGRVIAAVFTASEGGGDAEVLLMPPTRGERRSLASYTGAPNMDEHFVEGVLVFADATYESLMEGIRANPNNRKVPEMGALAVEKWAAVARNIVSSFETRLALDLLSQAPARSGLFAAVLSGRRLGNFDVLFDPRSAEQVMVGQLAASHQNLTYFDVWTSFAGRSRRNGPQSEPIDFKLSDYRIDATFDLDLTLSAVVRVKVTPGEDSRRVLAFDLARQMRVESATIDGQAAEVLQRESMRANLVRNTGNDMILVVPPAPLVAGRSYEVEFRERGKVVHDAGNHVYFVGARGSWYPNSYLQFATYDITFRHPRDLDLVTPGEVVERKTDGEWRVTRRRTASPIRVAGFNLGRYDSVRATRAGYTVDAYANHTVERALEPRLSEPVVPPTFPRTRRPLIASPAPAPELPSDPRARLQQVAADVAAALEFMSARFGPPALNTLTVSPVPGTFGQGFPGLIYLSTLTFLNSQDRPVRTLNSRERLFFSEIIQAHETAHQWWGNVVSTSGYHDDWMMEALASYSALLFLEKRKDSHALDMVLDDYRTSLLSKTDSGEIIDAVGPVAFGSRLENSQAPTAWRAIIYGKGSWIMHMLRRQMGDTAFLEMLHELRRRWEFKTVNTEQFRELAAGYLPPKSPDPKLTAFFDQWVYGTGIPSLKLSYSLKGAAPNLRLVGTITQSEVDANFSVPVPVEVQVGRAKPMVRWVSTSSDPVTFTIPLRLAPTKVVLDPSRSVLRR